MIIIIKAISHGSNPIAILFCCLTNLKYPIEVFGQTRETPILHLPQPVIKGTQKQCRGSCIEHCGECMRHARIRFCIPMLGGGTISSQKIQSVILHRSPKTFCERSWIHRLSQSVNSILSDRILEDGILSDIVKG